jgi:hypothetical protein
VRRYRSKQKATEDGDDVGTHPAGAVSIEGDGIRV